jgi:glycerol-3-phosphate O-acyltransferase
MATLDRLEVPYDRKVQLDQFEPITVGAAATFSLESGDDPYEVYHDGQATVQQMVERALAERIARKKMDELGPSVPKIVAVIREHTEVLDDETIQSIADDLVNDA